MPFNWSRVAKKKVIVLCSRAVQINNSSLKCMSNLWPEKIVYTPTPFMCVVECCGSHRNNKKFIASHFCQNVCIFLVFNYGPPIARCCWINFIIATVFFSCATFVPLSLSLCVRQCTHTNAKPCLNWQILSYYWETKITWNFFRSEKIKSIDKSSADASSEQHLSENCASNKNARNDRETEYRKKHNALGGHVICIFDAVRVPTVNIIP